MKTLFFLLISLLLLDSFSQEEKKEVNPNGYNVFYFENGNKSSEGTLENGKPVGVWKNYFETGGLKSEGKIENGKQNGVWKFYDEKGRLIKEVTYLDNKKNGALLYYASQDTLLKTEIYENDVLIGERVTYFANGCIQKEENFKEGELTGKLREYAEDDGRLLLEETYIDGKRTNQEILNRYDEQGRRTGLWREYHDNGNIKSEVAYSEGEKDGVEKTYNFRGSLTNLQKYENGVTDFDPNKSDLVEFVREFYPDGSLKMSGATYLGMKQGMFKFYSELGDTLYTELYEQDTLIAKGNMDAQGIYQDSIFFYNAMGVLTEMAIYKNGQRNGAVIYYYPNGKVKLKGKFKNDMKHGFWTSYYYDRTERAEFYYIKDKLDGEYVEYDSLGKVLVKGSFAFGLRDGKWEEEIGDHVEKGKYNEGERTGDWEYYFLNGKLHYKGEYRNGKPLGKHKYYYENGKLSRIERYQNGTPHGKWVFLSEKGEVIRLLVYKRGKIVNDD